MQSAKQERALELARTTELTRAGIARELDEPYGRVYKWLYKVRLHRDELADEQRAKHTAKVEHDRRRLPELVARYRRGELVHGPPWWTHAEASAAITDAMLHIADDVDRLLTVTPSPPGEPLTADETRVLEHLDALVLMKEGVA